MYIFALDSCAGSAACAVTEDGRIAASLLSDSGLTHSATLMPLCERAFATAGITPADIDVFACTAGPGSFTGLRIGMATVKGMAFPFGTPCAGVSATLALAMNCDACDALAVPVMDARAGRVYFSAYDLANGLEQLLPERAERIALLPDILSVFGRRVIFVGDAAQMCYNTLQQSLECSVARFNSVRAENVAAAAEEMHRKGLCVSGADLAPNYIQLPQAQRELESRRMKEVEKNDCTCK